MKFKLSTLSMMLLPVFVSAAEVDTLNTMSKIAKKAEAKEEPNLPLYAPDSVIVGYHDGTTLAEKKAAFASIKGTFADSNSDGVDDKLTSLMDGQLAHVNLNGGSVEAAIEILSLNPNVEFVEPDYYLYPSKIPNDKNYDKLWAHYNAKTVGADMNSQAAWDITTGSKSVVIGVIDSGITIENPDLKENLWVNPNEIALDNIDNDNNGYIDDMHGIDATLGSGELQDSIGHGTHVAGTIGAKGNNGIGVTGVAWDVSLSGCRFLTATRGKTSDAISCINYYIDLKKAGVNVVALNNSWGGPNKSEALGKAIDATEKAGILFLAAAGNDAFDNDEGDSYPSNYENDNIIAVASTDKFNNMSWFSQWGLKSVDLGAPGSSIYSTLGSDYDYMSGTSMATPQVTGAIALAYSVNKDLTAAQAKAYVMDTVDKTESLKGKVVTGGQLNLERLLLNVKEEPNFYLAAKSATIKITAGESAKFEFSTESIADWAGDISLKLDTSLKSAKLSANKIKVGESFTVSVDTKEDDAWGDYDIKIITSADTDDDENTADLVKSKMARLDLRPVDVHDYTYVNKKTIKIPDWTKKDNVGAFSTINVPEDLTTFGIKVDVDLTHSVVGEVYLVLISPSGEKYPLKRPSSNTDNNLVATYKTEFFKGQAVKGDWKLNAIDVAPNDIGVINEWMITFDAIGDVAPMAPATDFIFDNSVAYEATFTDKTVDRNNDMTSWSWDFGDDETSTDRNPVHTYQKAGSYEVSLTVKDAEGLSHTDTQTVNVADFSSDLRIRSRHVSRLGTFRNYLRWTKQGGKRILYRNGKLVAEFKDRGRYRDTVRIRGNSETEYNYKLCTDNKICSKIVTSKFKL